MNAAGLHLLPALQQQVINLQEQLQRALSNTAAADEACELRGRLDAALEQLQKSRKEADGEGRVAREALERSERAEGLAREAAAELQRLKKQSQRADQAKDSQSQAEILRLRQELREQQRLTQLAEEGKEAAVAQACKEVEAAMREELHAVREAAKRTEKELRYQVSAAECR